MSESERPLNSLETIFASCNVRFALLVVLDHENKNTSSLLAALQQSTAGSIESSVLGHLILNKNEQGEWSLIATEKVVAQVKIRDISSTRATIGKDYGAFLHKLVHQETLPAEAPLCVQILKDDSSSNRFIGLLVNGNHAMVDGRSLTRLIYLATNTESEINAVTQRQAYHSLPKLQDWKDLVEQNSTQLTAWNDNPPFLFPQHDILTMKELCRQHTSKGGGHFELELSGDTKKRLRALMKQHTGGDATMSGFLSGILLQSLVQEYHQRDPKALAISMLVDLRPYVAIGQQNGMGEIPQLHGSVNLVESTDRLTVETGDYVDTTRVEKYNIWDLSLSLTRQLKSRVEQGEAHRNALALTSGKFDQTGPSATLELSNLGVCQLPRNAKLFTSQRFDGYNGVTCMIHSESSTGCMRWNVSIGEGLDADMIQRVFQRAHGYCLHLVADQC